ncbi:MAG: type II toxin-antitoxin system VapC family toxin [Pseudomonadaceae bacterium]
MARPEAPKVVYLDSSALIAAIKGEPSSEPIQALLAEVEKGRVTLIASSASLVEVRGGGHGNPVDPVVDKRIRAMFEGPNVILIELDRAVGLKAREFAQSLKLDTWDAVHLASAVVGGAEVLMAIDEDFPIDTEVEGVWVSKPYPLGGPSLFNVTSL